MRLPPLAKPPARSPARPPLQVQPARGGYTLWHILIAALLAFIISQFVPLLGKVK